MSDAAVALLWLAALAAGFFALAGVVFLLVLFLRDD